MAILVAQTDRDRIRKGISVVILLSLVAGHGGGSLRRTEDQFFGFASAPQNKAVAYVLSLKINSHPIRPRYEDQ